jgi:hypothetical protein
MKRTITVGAIAALLVTAAPADAHAAGWHTCPGVNKITTSWSGLHLWTAHLRVRSPMNCASARYALSQARRRWLRDGEHLPRGYYDGYVTWHGRATLSGVATYHEHTSGTAFRFRFDIWS